MNIRAKPVSGRGRLKLSVREGCGRPSHGLEQVGSDARPFPHGPDQDQRGDDGEENSAGQGEAVAAEPPPCSLGGTGSKSRVESRASSAGEGRRESGGLRRLASRLSPLPCLIHISLWGRADRRRGRPPG